MKMLCGTQIFILLLTLSGVVSANSCNQTQKPTPGAIWTILKTKTQEGCYSEYVEKFLKGQDLQNSALTEAVKQEKTQLSWKLLVELADSSKPVPTNSISDLYVAVSRRAEQAAKLVGEISESKGAPGAAVPNAWNILWIPGILPATSASANDDLQLKKTVVDACIKEIKAFQDNTKTLCPESYKSSEKLIEVILIGHRIGIYYGRKIINDLASDLHAVNEDWNQFLFKSKPMYPLDLIATDLLYRWFSDYDKSSEGFKVPPNYQWFFLHPSPGFEYVKNAEDGQQLKPTIYLEVLGVNAWRKKYITGASVIVSYADRKGINDVGGGILFTFKNTYGVAIIRHGHETGVMFSLDVANFYRDKLKPTLDKIR